MSGPIVLFLEEEKSLDFVDCPKLAANTLFRREKTT